jgi:TPR repeat protein
VDLKQAVAFYRKAGELGHSRAAFMLGECYRYGIGVESDPVQAMVWYRKAARLFDAKLALADMYYFGQGIAQNQREAMRWFTHAVEQHEDAYAMYSLGFCLLHGHGTQRNLANAREGGRWLRKAAAMGEVDAQYELGCAYYRGDGVTRSLRLAMKWLRSAANLGNESAQAFVERVQHGDRLN